MKSSDPVSSPSSADTPEGSEPPRCTICGAVATEFDIDNNWWPPCEHAKTHGLHTLAYGSHASAAPRAPEPSEPEDDELRLSVKECGNDCRQSGGLSDG